MTIERLLLRLSIGIALAGILPALADNCGSEDDCKAVPTNVDTATGIAGVGAGGAILWALTHSGRRRPPKPAIAFDPSAGLPTPPPPVPPEEGTGTSGSAEDLFGGGPPDRPLGEDKPPGHGGPPDGPLGEDRPPRPGGPPDGPLGEDKPPRPGGPPDGPLGEDNPPRHGGPPDGPLGEDPTTRPSGPSDGPLGEPADGDLP